MRDPKGDLLQGTLDLLILRTLQPGPRHGWSISKRIQELSREILTVNQGSLYPALYRLEDRGWLASDWDTSPEGRRIKLYRLTPLGKKQLATETEQWKIFSLAVNHILQGA
jgi:transcriptional regulator